MPDRKLSLESSRSTLPRPVQQLVTLIFDVGQCPSSVCGSRINQNVYPWILILSIPDPTATTEEFGNQIVVLTLFCPIKITEFLTFLILNRLREKIYVPSDQCCGSMTFWYGSKSSYIHSHQFSKIKSQKEVTKQ